MTDNEIIKALTDCVNSDCNCLFCPVNRIDRDEFDGCKDVALELALDLINRQKGTVEGLRDEIEHLHEVIDDLYETIEGWDI